MDIIKAFLDWAAHVNDPIPLIAGVAVALIWLARPLISKVKKVDVRVFYVATAALLVLGLTPMILDHGSKQIYRVRVTVLDPSGMPVDEADVNASASHEKTKISGGYELSIPRVSLPSGGKVTFFAHQKDAFLTGTEERELKDDLNLSVTIHLSKKNSGIVRGSVQDESGKHLAGVKVNIAGHDDVVETSAQGAFTLSAHAATGQSVRIHLEKDGYEALDRETLASDDPQVVVMTKLRE